MRLLPRVTTALASVVLLLDLASAAERRASGVTDLPGRTIKTFTEAGTPVPVSPIDHGGGVASGRSVAAQTAGECLAEAATNPLVTARSGSRNGASVDSCGRVAAGPKAAVAPSALSASAGVTIDSMSTSNYVATYNPGGTVLLLGSADRYTLSDGTSWDSGAGTLYSYSTALDRVEVSGDTIRYVLFEPPYSGYIFQQTDYDSGDHSAQGTLAAAGPIVIEAVAGSTTAVMRGHALVVANDATWYGEPRFNYYSAIVGSVVPFEETYTLQGGTTWQSDTFARSFDYLRSGEVDFAHPVSTPEVLELTIGGPAEVPEESVVQFSATARYANGVSKTVTAASTWTAEPPSLGTIDGGLLTIAKLATPRETVTLGATYTEGSATVTATKAVVCLATGSVESGAWPMFQANAQHTGYLPLTLDPAQASLRWQRNLGGTYAVNPVAAAEGRVFATLHIYFNDVTALFALDASTGDTLWSKGFGSVFSVNPPSTAYGTVYVQTGNHANDTFLRAYDAGSGAPVFQVPHSAQWERYYAPTLYDGKAYVDGGYYGGMYGFDAYSGAQEWFTDLPQYDQWTPAISGDLAHSYVGEYSPGLYSVDRNTGRLVSVIPDPNFEWNGWSMDMAPVVGGNGDVFAIHDGRLISFDVSLRAIRWELQRSFVGQPSEALGKIYAIDGGRLVALDEATGNELWSWQPPEAPVGPMIVTNTHILVSTATSVHAVSLETRDSVWSYPVAGYLALADGNLYVASADGTLTAIAMPSSAAADLEGLEIVGPTEVVESFSAQYRAFAHYSDGQVQERTFSSTWSVEPGTYARIDTHGVLTTAELIRPAEDLLIRAHYEEGGRSSDGALNVHLVAGVSLTDLIIRNLVESLEIKEGILRDIDAALERERAARALRSSAALRIAINREVVARRQVVNSMKLLNVILKKLGYVAPPVASATREGAATDQSGER